MDHRQKPIRQLLLGALAIGAGALAQNFLKSRPFLGDALFVFGVGSALLVLAVPRGGIVLDSGVVALKRLRLGAQYKAILYVLFAIALGAYAVTNIKGNLMPLQGWFAFVGSLLLVLTGWRSWDAGRGLDREPSRTPAWEIAAIILVILIAAFMRFPGLESMPFGVWYDEAVNGLDSIPVAEGKSFPVYFEANFGRAALSFYVNALLFKLLGVSLFVLRLTPAIAGVLTIPVFYKMARQFFGPHPALVGAFLLAVSRWHVNFSRVAFDAVFLPLLACATIYFLTKGFRTKRTVDFAIGGMALGLSLHTYMAARLFPLVVIIYLAHKLVFERRSYRSVFPGLVAFGLAAFFAAAPLLMYAYNNQTAFTARTTTASVFAGKTPEQGQAALRANIEKHLLMFSVRGDPNGRHNIPGEPMLDQLTAVLFVIGAGYSLWNWRRPAHFVLLTTFVVLISGGVLSVDFEAPQALRAIGIIPAVFAFAALPLGFLWQALEARRPAGPSLSTRERFTVLRDRIIGTRALPDGLDTGATIGRPVWALAGSIGVLASLAWVGSVNHNGYFTKQAASFASWNAFSTAETAIAYRLRDLKTEDWDIFMTSLYPGHPSIRFLTPQAPKYDVFDLANGIPLRTAKKGVVIFLEPQQIAAYQQLQRYYPGGTFEVVTNEPYGGPPTIYDARISREEIGRIQGLNVALYEGEVKEGDPIATDKAEKLEFDWSTDAKVERPFVGEWRGTLFVPQYGNYQFAMEGATKATLYLDESPLLDAEEHPTAQATLAKGNHAVRLEAAVGTDDDGLRIKWQIPGRPMSVVTNDYLYVPPVTSNGLLGTYYRSPDWQGAPAFAQIDPSIAFYFHLIPLPRPYSVEWSGKVYAPVDGRYTFGIELISAAQLSIDGQLLVDNKVKNQYKEGAISLEAGFHDINLRFQDKDPFSHIYLFWTAPGKGRELIPSQNLFPPQGSYEPPPVLPDLPPQQPPKVETPAVSTSPSGPTAPLTPQRMQPALQIGRKGSGDGEFNEPRAITVDKEGNIYVADTGNARVQKFGPDGKLLSKIGKRGNGDGEFQEPLAIVIDSSSQLLVLDSATGWIHRFDSEGAFKGKIAGPAAQLFHARGLSIDGKDNLYIADTGGSRIVIYSSSGQFVGTFGAKGGGNGQFLEPVDAVVLADGSILISDVANKRIQKLDSNYKYVAQWKVPEAVAFNGGHFALGPDGSIYATEPEQHRVTRYDGDMKPLGTIGARGEGPGQFSQPVGLFVDDEGNLFVADTYNHRIQKLATVE